MNISHSESGAKKRRRYVAYFFALLPALLTAAPARAGHWEISYRVGGGVAYNEENHEPTQGMVSAAVSGNPSGIDTETSRKGRAPWMPIEFDPLQPMSSGTGASGSFLFEAGFVRADTQVDGSVTAVFDWMLDSPTDTQPPPEIVQVKEIALARAEGTYAKQNSYEDNGIVDPWIAYVSNGLDAAVASSPNAQPEPHGVDTAWKEANSEKNVAIANPARSRRVVLPTRNLQASSRGGMTKPTCFYGENWTAAAASRVEYKVERGPERLQIKFSGNARACAGGVADDNVHSVALTATANLANEPVTFVFSPMSKNGTAINYAGLKAPKFLVNGAQLDVWQTTTDANKKVTLTILSSDLISRPRILATQTAPPGQEPIVRGEVECDFAAAESRRRFGYALFNEGSDYDTGWEAVTPGTGSILHVLSTSGEKAALKLYLKFRKQNVTSVTYKATVTKGTPLSDDANWQNVGGHSVVVTLAEVARKLDTGESWAPESEFDDYVTLCDAQGVPQTSVTVTTDNEGVSAPVYVKGGSLIHKVVYFSLRAIDQTQLKR